MEKKSIILLLIALTIFIFTISGCEFIGNITNRDRFKKRITELVKTQGVVVTNPYCEMIGTNRVGIYLFNAPKEDIDVLVRGLNLKKIDKNNFFEETVKLELYVSSQDFERVHNFLSKHWETDSSKITVFVSQGYRPTQIRGFEYFLLYWDYELENACIQFRYTLD